MIYKAQHRKVKIKHHEHSNKTGMNSGASEGWTDPATLVAPVVLYRSGLRKGVYNLTEVISNEPNK